MQASKISSFGRVALSLRLIVLYIILFSLLPIHYSFTTIKGDAVTRLIMVPDVYCSPLTATTRADITVTSPNIRNGMHGALRPVVV